MTTRPPIRSLAAVTLVGLALAIAGTASASPAPQACSLFGTVVGIGDADRGFPLAPLPGFILAFVDNGNGFFSPGEPAYLDTDVDATVSTGDVRVTGASGSIVLAGDGDLASPLTVLPGDLGFVDANGGGLYTSGDPVYWNTDSSGVVSAADVRLTPSLGGAAGTAVALGDADLNDPLVATFGTFAFIDSDADALFTEVDVAYLAMDGGFVVQPGAVRLSGYPSLLVAEPVANLPAAPIGLVTPAFRATLSSLVTGQPIPGATVGFYVDGQLLCSAPTDGTGTAACGTVVEKAVAVAHGGYEARYTGSFPHCGSQADGSIL